MIYGNDRVAQRRRECVSRSMYAGISFPRKRASPLTRSENSRNTVTWIVSIACGHYARNVPHTDYTGTLRQWLQFGDRRT